MSNNFSKIVSIAGIGEPFSESVFIANANEIGNTVEVVNQVALPTPSLALQGLIHFAKAENTYHVINLAGNAFEIFGAGAGGVSGIELNWTFNTSTTEADPGSSAFRLNSATPASVTELFISTTSNSGADISAILSELKSGNTLYARQIDDQTKNLVLNVVSIVDNTTWFKITVTVDDSTTLFGSGKEIAIIFMFSGMSAGDMTKAVYDPTSINGDAFLMSNMVETAGEKILTSAERTAIIANTAKVTNANHSGDATGDTVLTIADNAVTLAKMADMATASLLGRNTAATGDPEVLSATTARSLLNVENGSTADQTNSEIETAYNAQVGAMSQATAEAGTSTTIERVTAQRIAQAISKLTPVQIIISASDVISDLETGTAKVTFRMPFAMTLTGVRASVSTAPTGSSLIVDINESGVTILSTKLSIDATEETSTTAATPAVISDTALADDAEMTIDIDQIGSTIAGKELLIYLIGVPA
ncbi:MAG: hypothetical protein IID03_11855 [Candidatus Dadabacteria bacterium]|nr:hypothetical protein [Candidatus Dadabacteria bacterium]